MKYYRLLYVAGLLAMTAACTNDDMDEQMALGEKVPVTLSYQTLEAVANRASASQTLNQDYIESGKSVTVRISNTGADSYTNYIYTTGAAGVMNVPAANAPYYPLDGTNIDIKAYYPVSASGSHTVQADQSTNDNYTASDLMWATPITDQAKTASAVTLNFTHKMAKMVMNVTPGSAVKQINSVTLKQVKRTIGFSISDGTLGALSGSAEDITVITGEATDGAVVHGAAVIPPQTINGNLLQIGVTMSDGTTGTATYTVASKAFAANNVYTLNITVNGPEVNTSTAIGAWANNGSVTINPETYIGPEVKVFTVNGVSFRMIKVKGGATLANYASTGNSPATGTSLKITNDYWIAETETTNGLWNAVMGGKPTGQKNNGDSYPVACVSWYDITTGTANDGTAGTNFLSALNTATSSQRGGMTFRLPTEGEWEYAARGGRYSNGYTYAGSNYLENVAWWGNNGSETFKYTNPSSVEVSGNSAATTHEVRLMQPNELALYDMSGNVWEWCSDWYGSLTNNTTLTDPTGAASGSHRVYRGGCWYYTAPHCAVSSRGGNTPTGRYYALGFRLVLQ